MDFQTRLIDSSSSNKNYHRFQPVVHLHPLIFKAVCRMQEIKQESNAAFTQNFK